MVKTKVLIMAVLSLVLLSVLSAVSAQDADAPVFGVSEVVTDEKVVLNTKNFPAEMDYNIYMADADSENDYVQVAKFNSGKKGGNLIVTVKISDEFKGLNNILLRLTSADGNNIDGAFTNIAEEPAAEEAVMDAAEEPTDEAVEETLDETVPEAEDSADEAMTDAAEEPADEAAEETADEAVPEAEDSADEAMTDAAEEPAEEAAEETLDEAVSEAEDSTDEAMTDATDEAAEETADESPETEVPAEEPVAETVGTVCDYSLIPCVTIDAVVRNESVTFTIVNFPAEKTFSVLMGIQNMVEAGTFESGDGSVQTLTFDIPESLAGYTPITLRIQDQGECGFYAYNYFYNTSTN